VDVDLERAVGWTGARAHVEAIHTFCLCADTAPRPLRTLDQDDVPTRHIRVYEAWLEQGFASGAGSLLAGAYDLKNEFDRVHAADGLMGASFGLSPELANSGPFGAPGFPSTSLAARLRLQPSHRTYLMAAAIDASPGAIGDRGGLDVTLRRGALVMGEAGLTDHHGRFAVGYWRYTGAAQGSGSRLAPDLQSRAGGYALFEAPLTQPSTDRANLAVFLRAGLAKSAGAFRGGMQAGLRLDRVFAARPDSSLTLGVTRGQTEQPLVTRGPVPSRWAFRTQTGVELSYADRIGRNLSLQPDVQWTRWSGHTGPSRQAVAFILRATFRLPG
jgi:porin